MASKSGLVVVVSTAALLSLSAGTYLAYRSNRPESTAAAGTTQALKDKPRPAAGTSKAVSPSTTAAPTVARPQTPKITTPAPKPAARRNQSPTVSDKPEPASTPTVSATLPATSPIVPPPVDPPAAPPVSAGQPAQPSSAKPPEKPRFEEVTVKADGVIGIRLEQTISSETARVEDRVTARITRDVTVDGRTALPMGTKLEGVVAVVERGGKVRERSKLGIRFTMLILADNQRVPIQTEIIFREGESPTGEAGSKIGAGAVVGAIFGAMIGGKKGAAIGSTAGAAGGTAAVMAGSRNEAVFTSGAPLTVRLTKPVTVTIERDPEIR